jgi:site-specific recombinase XerD
LGRASSHWLRNTFAKTAILKGLDLRVIAAALGQASIAGCQAENLAATATRRFRPKPDGRYAALSLFF